MGRRALAWIALTSCVLGLIFGCSQVGSREPEPEELSTSGLTASLVSVAVTPNPASFVAGTFANLTATGTYSNGKTKKLSGVTWGSSNPAVSVSSSGKVTSLTPGTAVITATKSGVSGNALVTVTAATLKSLKLSVSGANLPVGVSEPITATGTFSDGTSAPMAPDSLAWSSSAPAIGAITSPGVVTGVSAGSTTITATSGAISAHLKVTVAATALASLSVTPATASVGVGDVQAFVATGTYSDGSTWDVTTNVTWTVSTVGSPDGGADTVDVDVVPGGAGGPVASIGTDGVATGLHVGDATIGATLSSIAASAALTVTPNISWTLTGSMTTPRRDHTATLLGSGKVLIAGGGSTGVSLSSAELYDPTAGTFAPTGSMSVERSLHTATRLLSGQVLVAGGSGTTIAELYDPATGTFTLTGSMTAPRSGHTATLLDSGQVLLAGGPWGAELYDPTTGTFTATAWTFAERLGFTATLLASGLVLIAGGYDSVDYLSGAMLFDPTMGTFAATGSMTAARQFHTATLLASGKVLIAGGYDGVNRLSSAELYDPTTGTFTATGPMTMPRVSPRATLVPSGQVLVVGGGDHAALASGELYDPATGAFTPAGSMNDARKFFTATLLGDGKVLATGGVDSVIYSSAELFP